MATKRIHVATRRIGYSTHSGSACRQPLGKHKVPFFDSKLETINLLKHPQRD